MRKGGQRTFSRSRARNFKSKLSFVLTITIFLLSSYLFIDSFLGVENNFSPELSGSVVGVEKIKSDPVNVVFDRTGDYIWVLPEKVSISSLKVSGEFEDKGLVKIFVEKEGERYLLFDSSKRQGDFIQGDFVSEEVPFEDIPQDISTLDELEQPLEEETDITERIPEELNITEEGYVGVIVEKEKKPKKVKFSSVCVASCELIDFNESFYKIVFEVVGTQITVNSIDYGVEEKINTANRIDIFDKEGNEIAFHKVTETDEGEYDIEIDLPSDFDFSLTGLLTGLQVGAPPKPGVKIKGLKTLPEKLKFRTDVYPDEKLKSVVFASPEIEIDNATLTLPKQGEVDAIFECSDFDVENFNCPSSWTQTQIPFADNGDTITFTVSHFSGYAGGIINITKADHLDTNRVFISDIYNEAKSLDGVWSETIPSGDYVRVTFEQNLTNVNDITLYPRTISGTPRVEIYEIGETTLIAEFSSLNDNQYNKIYLTNLQGTQDRFDLKVLGGSVQFDHIVDPAPTGPTLNSPTNASTAKHSHRLLNITVSDPDSDPMNVSIYGDNSTSTELIAFFQNQASGTTLTYNWTAPTISTVFSGDTGLMAYWKLDSDANDYSGNNNNGTISGAFFNKTNGKLGGAAQFDGVTDYIKIPYSQSLNISTGKVTITAWINAVNDTAYKEIVNKRGLSTGLTQYDLRLDPTEQLTFYWRSSSWQTVTSTDPIPIGQWVHVVGSRDDATNTVLLYVNGVLVKNSTSITNDMIQDATNVTIGSSTYSLTTDEFNGKIDEVGIWNRILSSAEIASLYSLGNGTYYWKADANDGSATTTSATNQFTVGNNAPGTPTFNSPSNASTAKPSFRLLNTTAPTDADGDAINVSIYGDNTTASSLLAFFQNPTTGTELTYNFTSLPVGSLYPSGSTGLVGYWNFDKNASDFSGRGQTATHNGNAFVNTTGGYFAGGLQLDGTGDYDTFTMASGAGTSLTTGTMIAWVKANSIASYKSILGSRAGGGNRGLFLSGAAGNPLTFSWDNADNEYNGATGLTLSTGQWYFAAVVINSGNAVVYLGSPGGTLQSYTNSNSNSAQTIEGDWYIGRDSSNTARDWNGIIDDVAIFNRSLSSSEITDLYRLGYDTYYWKVDATDGTSTTTSATNQFTVANTVPSAPTLNSPANASTDTATFRLLNTTVTDPDADTLNVSIYGDNSSASNLIAFFSGISNGTTLTYNWTSPVVSSLYANNALGLVSYWNFDKNASDYSTLAQHGTLNGNAFINTTGGYHAGGLQLRGASSGDYVSTTISSNVPNTNNFTMLAWVYPKALAASEAIASSRQGGGHRGLVLSQASGFPLTFSWDDASNEWNAATGLVMSTNNWYLAAAAVSSTGVTVYLGHPNGTLQTYTDTNANAVKTASGTWNIGHDSFSAARQWNGTIDGLALFNRTLTTAEITDLFRLPNSTYYWRADANDGTDTTNSATRQFTVGTAAGPDTTNPSVVLNSPADAASTSSPVTFNTTVTDSGGVANVTLYIDGVANTTNTSGVSGEYTFSKSLSSGGHNWSILAYDTSGNSNQSATRTLTISAGDTTAPSVTLNTPTAGWYNSNFVVNATVTDDTAVSTVQYRYENSSTNGSWVSMTNPSGNLWNATFSVSSVADGNYTFRINATDNSANSNSTVTVANVAIDDTSPTSLSFVSPTPASGSNQSSTSYTVNLTFTETNPNNCLFDDGSTNQSMTRIGSACNITLSGQSDGTKTYRVHVNDSAGNLVVSDSRTVTIDSSNPAVTARSTTYPGSQTSATNGQTVTLNATVTDATTGVQTVTVNAQDLGCSSTLALNKQGSSTSYTNTCQLSSATSGTKSLTVTATDFASNSNTTTTLSVVVDATNPSLTLNSPANSLIQSSSSLTFNITATDSTGIQNVSLYIDNILNQTNTSGISGEYIFTKTIADGNHNWSVLVYDTVGNSNQSTTRSFTIDTIAPSLSITSPSISANLSVSTISILGTASDTNSDTIIINNSIFGSNVGSYTSWNFTNSTIAEGTYSVLITANDTAGNTQTATRTFTIDRTNPTVLSNSTTYPGSQTKAKAGDTITLRATLTDSTSGIQNATVNLGNVCTANTTLTLQSGSLYTGSCTIKSSPTEGTNQLTVTVYDYAGNSNTTTTLSVSIDNTAPTITVSSPTNTTYGSTSVQLNVTADETISKWWYSLNSESNTTFTPNTTFLASEGSNNIVIYANDSTNNVASSQVFFTVDTGAPTLSSVSTNDTDNKVKSTTGLQINITATDSSGVSTVIVGNLTNITMSSIGSNKYQTNTTASALGCTATDGSCVLKFYANDTVNNFATTTLTLTVDDTSPTISITSPTTNQNVSSVRINITGTVTETNQGSASDVVVNNSIFGSNVGSFSSFNFTNTSMADGTYSIQITATDAVGNSNTATIRFSVDTTAPTASYNSQTAANNANLSQNWYNVEIALTETNPDTCLLESNDTGSVVNYTMTRSGSICSLNRTGRNDGTYSFKTYFNDTAGNVGSTSSRTNTLDTGIPTISSQTVNYPSGQSMIGNGQTIILNTTGVTDSGTGINTIVVDASQLGCSGSLALNRQGSSNSYSNTCQLSGASSGTKVLPINATDFAGNSNTSISFSVEVDATNPTWSANQTNGSSTTKTGQSIQFNITLTDTNPDKYIFSFDNGAGSFTNDSAASYTSGSVLTKTKTITATAGQTVRWLWWFNDSAGNVNQTGTSSFVVADSPSSVSINTPTSGYYTSNFVVNATAADSDGLSSVQYRYENSSTNGSWVSMTNPSGNLWNATFSVSSVADGNYTFRINATDNSANSNSTVTVANVAIDDTSPTSLSFVSPTPASGSNQSSTSYTVNLTFTETNPNNCLFDDGSTNQSMTRIGSACNITLSGQSDGTKTYRVHVNDSAGNLVVSDSRTVTIDSSNPAVTARSTTYPGSQTSATNGQTVTLNATVTDATTGVQTVTVNAQDLGCSSTLALNKQGSSTSYTNTCQLSSATSGTKSLTVTATDFASNSNTTTTLSVVVDATNPSLTLNSPANSLIQSSSSLTFNITATDSTGIQNVSLYIDNILNQTNTSGISGEYIFTKTIADGNHNWSVLVYDTVGNSNQSTTRSFTIDTIAPSLSITSPSISANLSVSTISILGTASDTNSDTIIINNSIFGSNVGSYTSWNFTNSTIAEGTYSVLITANDTAGNTQTATRTFTIDRTNPTVLSNSTTYPGSQTKAKAGDTITLRATLTDSTSGIQNATVNLGNVCTANTTLTLQSGSLYTGSCTIKSSPTEGTNQLTVTVYDYAGNSNTTTTLSVSIDNTAPTITVSSPTNTTYGSTSVQLNVTADETISKWWYSLNSESNTTFTPNTTFLASEGSNNIVIYANDSTNNVASSQVFFTVDTGAPTLSSVSTNDTDNKVKSTTGLQINITATDSSGVSTVIVGNLTNITMSSIGSNKYQTNTTASALGCTATDGSCVLKFYANDTVNNFATTTLTLTVDDTSPTISITSPTTNQNVSSVRINITGTVTETNQGSASDVVVNNSIFGSNVGSFSSFNFTNTSMADGTYSIQITATDAVGNSNTATIRFSVDTTAPTIPSFVSPTEANNANVSRNWYYVNVTFTETNPDTCLLDDGTNTTMTRSGTNCYLNKTEQSNGAKTYKVYVNDTANNQAVSVTRTVTVDTTKPSVVLNSPASGSTSSVSSVTFNSTVSDTTLANVSLYIDGSLNQTNSSGSTGDYLFTLSLADATYSWYILATDYAGNQNQSATRTLTVSTDTTPPTLDFASPTPTINSNQSSTSVTINVTSVDTTSNIDTCILEWAGENESMTKVGSGTSVSCNKVKSGLVDGAYTFKVYSNDTKGNMNVTPSRTVRIDTINPSAILISPANNSKFNTSSITFQFNVTDSGSGVKNITKHLTGDDSSITVTQSGNYSVTINYGTITGGLTTETWYIFAYDRAGNLNQTETRTFRIDQNKPSTTATAVRLDSSSYTFNSWTNSTYVNITLSCSDGSGVGCDTKLYCTDTANTCSPNTVYTAPVQISTEGTSYIRYNSNDTAGNIEVTKSSTIKIDSISPLISYAIGTNNDQSNISSSSIFVNVSVTELNEDTITFKLFNTAGQVNSTSYTNGQRTINWTGLVQGTYTYNVTVNDSAGNTQALATRTIRLDTSAPSTAPSAIKSDGSPYTFNSFTNSSTVNVSLSCSDGSGLGCDKTIYCIDTSNTCSPNSVYSSQVQISTQGTSYFRYRSNDTIGNLESVSNQTIKIDSLNPSATTPQTSLGTLSTTTSVQINVTASDSASGISSVIVGNLTNQSMSSIGSNKYQITTTPADLGCLSNQTTCLLRFYANDSVNNINSTTTLTLNITACGQTITSSTTISSNSNVNGNCLILGANNVVINGNGKSITGSGSGTAINVSGFTNVTVANLTITNFTTDVAITTGTATLINTTFNRTKTTVSGTGNLTAKWYVDNVVREWGFEYFDGLSGGTGYCGDSKCGSGENQFTCSQDCSGNISETCGNGFCGYSETSSSCPADCGGGAGYCGNNVCNQGETNSNCPSDCQQASGQCNLNSTFCSGKIQSVCGQQQGACAWNSSASACQSNSTFCAGISSQSSCTNKQPSTSCLWSSGEVCGNGACVGSETSSSCPADCAGGDNYCGNGVCVGSETSFTCATDCGAPTPPGVSGANVTVYDAFGNIVSSVATSSSGSIPRLELTEFVQTSSGKTTYTIHSINISKSGYTKFSRILNLTASGSISLSHVLNKAFANCDSYNGNQTQCTAAKCSWQNDTQLCKPSFTALDCDQFCGVCSTQSACTGSSRRCIWESSGAGFCRENFNTFTYGSGGTSNSTGFFNFIPLDCSKDPSKCDSRFDVSKGYYKYETLCSDNVDNDNDGSSDCSDIDCSRWPVCSGSYNSTNDTTSPQITNFKDNTDVGSSDIFFSATEPTNATLYFYGTNSSCSVLNKTITEPDFPGCSLDNYALWHQFSLDSSQNLSLASNTSYYYKIIGYDQAGLKYETSCLNFTTKSSAQTYNFRIAYDGVKINTGSGLQSYNFTSGSQEFSRVRDAQMQVGGFTFGRANLAGSESLNLTGQFLSGTSPQQGTKFTGFNTSTWLETAQKLGMRPSDNVTITVEGTGDKLYKCDDNGENCAEMTDCVSLVSSNSTHRTYAIAVAAGFSTYALNTPSGGDTGGSGGSGGSGGGGSSGGGSSGGSGGGGGGGGGVASVVKLDIVDAITDFVKKGEDKTMIVPINNTGNTKLDLKLQLSGLPNNLAALESDSISLDPGKATNINIKLFTSEQTEPGVYTGQLLISSPKINKTVSLIVEVETKKVLFDVKIDIPAEYREVKPGKTILSQILVINFGEFEKVDVVAKYKVKDLDNKVLLEDTETFAVEDQISFLKEIYIPTHFKEGDYVVIAEVHFQDTVTTSSQLIHVKVDSVQSLPETDVLIYVIIVVIGAVVVLVGYTQRKVKRVERKYRKKISKEYSKYQEKSKTEKRKRLLQKIKRRRGK